MPGSTNVSRLPNGATLQIDAGSARIVWPGGNQVLAKNFGGYLLVELSVTADHSGDVFGIFGIPDGDAGNDLSTVDGVVLDRYFDRPLTTKQHERLYQTFADGWRVSDASSLFHYEPGLTTASFNIKGFPDRAAELAAIQNADWQEANEQCKRLGIQDKIVLENCAFDLAMSGDISFARSALATDQSLRREPGNDSRATYGEFGFGSDPMHPDGPLEFVADAEEVFFFYTTKVGGTLDLSNLVVRDATGARLVRRCIRCTQLGRFRAPRAGTYSINLELEPGERGEFEVLGNRVQPAEHHDLRVGQVLSDAQRDLGAGNIEAPGAVDVYNIALKPNREYQLRVGSKQPTLYFGEWRMDDGQGRPVVDRQILPPAKSKSRVFAVPTEGKYAIHVDGGRSWPAGEIYGFGAYSLTVEEVATP